MRNFKRFAFVLVGSILASGFLSCGGGNQRKIDTLAEAVPEEESVWKYESLTDEFGDDNGEKVITGLFDGKFSNSVSDNSDAKLQIFYSDGVPVFRIFDDGTRMVKGDNFMRFKIKEGNGNVSVLYLLDQNGFFVPTEVPGTLGMNGIDSLLCTEQNIKLSGVLLEGNSDTDCLLTQMGYLADETGDSMGYIESTEKNRPKYQFNINPKGLKKMISNRQ